MKKKYVFIILIFLVSILCAVGGSTWIILSEQTAPPKEFTAIETNVKVSDIDETIENPTATNLLTGVKFYYGDEDINETIKSKITVYANINEKEVNLTSIFDVNFDITELRGVGTSDSVTGALDVSFSFKKSLEEDYKYVYEIPDNIKITVPMYAVAYIGATYYSTIDQALTEATSGNTIIVMPSDYATETNEKRVKAKTVGIIGANTLDVKSGVTLALPYDLNSIPSNTYGEDTTGHHPSAYTDTTKIKNIITVAEDKILNNYGKIKVYGKISGGNGGKAIASVTSADHARIIMNKNAQIISKNGSSLECYGYIVESSSDNSSKITIENDSKLSMMFTIVEHRGGTNFSNIYYDKSDYGGVLPCSPFVRFYLENITSRLRIDYGGRLTGHADLCGRLLISTQHNHTDINLIGVTTDSTPNLIELENSNSYVEAKHNGDTTDENYKVTDLKIFGNAEINSLEMKIISPTISTANIFFPISWYYNITLAGDNSTVTFNNQHIKILPGAKVTIEKGVTVDIGDLIVYNGFRDTLVGQSGQPAYEYNLDSNGNPISGTLIVNGTLIADNLAGKIFSKSESAKITVNNTTTLSSRELDSSAPSYYTKTENLSLNLYDTTTNTVSETMTTSGLTEGTYFSIKDANNNYGWYSSKFKITYETNGGNSISQTQVDLTSPIGYTFTEANLPTPTRAHYTFDGWYMDSNFTTPAIGQTIYGETTLYAKWSEIEYTIQYNVTYPDGYDPITIENSTFTIGDTVTPTIPTYGDLTFLGWFNAAGTTITTVSTADLDSGRLSADSNNVITLYGQFVSDYVVTFNINNNEIAEKIGRETEKTYDVSVTAAPNEVLTAEQLAKFPNAVQYDKDTSVSVEFIGWFKDEACTQTFDAENDIIESNTVLYAGWKEKNIVTITTENGYFEAVEFFVADGDTFNFEEARDIVTDKDNETTEQYKEYFNNLLGSDGVTYTLNDTLQIDEDMTFTAQWLDKIQLKITYENQNNIGSTTENVYWIPKTDYILPAAKTRIGHTFSKWEVVGSNKDDSYDGGATLTSLELANDATSITINATWTVKKITVNIPGKTSGFLYSYTYSINLTIEGKEVETKTASFTIDFGTKFIIVLKETYNGTFTGSKTTDVDATVKIGSSTLATEGGYYIAGKLSDGTYSDSDITIAKA